jgi:hypothetical protein
MEESVHRGAGEKSVVEERGQLLDVAIRRDQRRRALIATADDFVEVERLVTGERLWPRSSITRRSGPVKRRSFLS